jgi:hypothetical protein
MISRLKSRRGFTIGEVLVSVLILMMVFSIVAAGIPAAANAYYKVVDSANAQMLLSTTLTRLRTELSTATQVKCSGTTIEYRCAAGSTTKLWLAGAGDAAETGADGQKRAPGIWLQEYVQEYKEDPDAGSFDPDKYKHLLVSQKAASGVLYVTYESAYKSGGEVIFTECKVMKAGRDEPLASMDSFRVRVLAEGLASSTSGS